MILLLKTSIFGDSHQWVITSHDSYQHNVNINTAFEVDLLMFIND